MSKLPVKVSVIILNLWNKLKCRNVTPELEPWHFEVVVSVDPRILIGEKTNLNILKPRRLADPETEEVQGVHHLAMFHRKPWRRYLSQRKVTRLLVYVNVLSSSGWWSPVLNEVNSLFSWSWKNLIQRFLSYATWSIHKWGFYHSEITKQSKHS